jgi:nucleoside-diphosphate-sugar epimerase
VNIVVVGATGVLGRNVVPRLIELGHTVKALVRTPEQAQFLLQMGAEPTLGDIFDKPSLNDAARGCQIALHLATAIPKSAVQGWEMNDRIRREGTHNFISAASDNGVKRYIQQSITLLYGDHGQAIVDESTPPQPDRLNQSAIDMEGIVRASALEWCILRGGLFYGAGTGREDGWRQAALQGRLELPGDGNDLISLIHVVDMARAVVVAAGNAPSHGIYNIVDDEATSYRRLFSHITAQLGLAAPGGSKPKFLPSLGCSNTRFKQELAWQPVYPSYKSGLV